MLSNIGSQMTLAASLNVASQAAGANNGSWVDISAAEGEILVTIPIGAVTGSVIVKIQDADDTGGTNSADLSGVVTSSLSTANSAAKLSFPSSSARKAVRAVATVTTGPILMGATVCYVPKIV